MKISKLKFYTLGIVTTLSIACNVYLLKKEKDEVETRILLEQELEKTQEELENQKRIAKINSIEELNEYFDGYLRFDIDNEAWLPPFNYASPQLVITKKIGEIDISDELYEKINGFLSGYEFESLRLENLDSSIDLSRIKLTNTDNRFIELVISNCRSDFNYKALSNFHSSSIDISNNYMFSSVKEWLTDLDLSNIRVNICGDFTPDYLDFFIEEKKILGTININVKSEGEILNRISQINAKNVVIRPETTENLNYALVVNENTKCLELSFPNYDGDAKYSYRIGEIQVDAACPNFLLKISSNPGWLGHLNSITYITPDTTFKLPEDSSIEFYNIRYMTEEQIEEGLITLEPNVFKQRLDANIEYYPGIDFNTIIDEIKGKEFQKTIE